MSAWPAHPVAQCSRADVPRAVPAWLPPSLWSPLFGFGPQQRFHTKRDYEKVFSQGRRIQIGPVRALVFVCEAGSSRLGVVAQRKLGKAHVRNRCKRLCREWFRLHQHLFKRPVDLVLIPQSEKLLEYTCEQRKNLFEDLLKRIHQQAV